MSRGGVLILTLLEHNADRLVLVKIFLLALDVAIHDDATVVAVDLARFEAYWTDSEVGADIFSSGNFVWDQVLVVPSIGIGTEVHKEFGDVLGSTHRSEMKRCVAILV